MFQQRSQTTGRDDDQSAEPTLSREQTIIDIRETPVSELARIWPYVEREWGDDASRIWQEALSAQDASDT
jgi:hypothetical protein